MRTIIFILLLCPVFALAQKSTAYIKLTDARGQLIKGGAFMKGFENWVSATSFNNGGRNNTQLNFTMMVNGASADLKRALTNGELLTNGQVSVLAPVQGPGRPMTSYDIRFERVTVLSCSEGMGCDGKTNTTVTLQATRIGWTYYNETTGAVTRKYGWDADANKEWTAF